MEQSKVQAAIHKNPLSPETLPRQDCVADQATALPWIQTIKNHSYFVTENGKPWTPIGQNDAVSWPELKGLFQRRDLASADAYLATLAAHGVTCLRLMLEYCHGQHRYFENPAGRFQPNMVQLWDDLFALCGKHGLRILLTPFDTFWMWRRWKHHPYNKANGGACAKKRDWLLCPQTRKAIKQRLLFATQRWGGSGALFAWDLWNEIHPAQANRSTENFAEFVSDIGGFLRAAELQLHGKAHPQTVSVFGPVLNSHPSTTACIFRHPALDFASVHFYENKSIDWPRNTVDAAIATGRLTKEALNNTNDNRPFFDSEHGPIRFFKKRRTSLPESFDDDYFHHMQWAHFASGGAGGGMRWPYRHPHSLTAGMRAAQRSLSNFLPLMNWQRFRRRNWNDEIQISNKSFVPFGCGDEDQGIVWLLRRDAIGRNGMLRSDAKALSVDVSIPMKKEGCYHVVVWDTKAGRAVNECLVPHGQGENLCLLTPPMRDDAAFCIRRVAGNH